MASLGDSFSPHPKPTDLVRRAGSDLENARGVSKLDVAHLTGIQLTDDSSRSRSTNPYCFIILTFWHGRIVEIRPLILQEL